MFVCSFVLSSTVDVVVVVIVDCLGDRMGSLVVTFAARSLHPSRLKNSSRMGTLLSHTHTLSLTLSHTRANFEVNTFVVLFLVGCSFFDSILRDSLGNRFDLSLTVRALFDQFVGGTDGIIRNR